MTCVLALDTSGRSADVAVARDGELLACVAHDGDGGYAESLLPLIDRALKDARIALEGIDAVAVVEGPGSFTGLRIGIMTAKTLSFARGLRLLSATTLELLAAVARRGEAGPGARTCIALVDAGRGHAFAAAFALSTGGTMSLMAPPERVAHAELAAWVRSHPLPATIAATGAETLAAARAAAGTDAAVGVVTALSLAGELASAATHHAPFVRGVDPARLVPVYLSPSQAERARGLDLRDEVHRPAGARPAAEPL